MASAERTGRGRAMQCMRTLKMESALAAYHAALRRGADPMELRLLYDAVRRRAGYGERH